MKRLAWFAALLAALVLAAGAANATSVKTDNKRNECVFISSIRDYRALDRDKVIIWAPSRRDAYLVELTLPLFGLQGSWRIATIDRDHDGRLCGFSSDRIAIENIGAPESASIRSMTKLSDADLAALEQQYAVTLRPKTKKNAAEHSDAEHSET